MATTEKSSMYFVKISILAMGAFMLTVGITPYIFSYLDTATDDIVEVQDDANTDTKPLIVKEITPPNTLDNKTKKLSDTSIVITDNKKQIDNPQPEIETTPFPTLHDSDDFILNQLNDANTESLFIPADIVRNMVVFIDNFSRGEVINRFSPLHKPVEAFSVSKQNGITIIDNNSYGRYDKYSQVIDSLDPEQFMELYTFLTPLLNEAYQEIGYQEGSFNSTFIAAIDQVLDTPIINYALEVNSPSVMYQYTDENLESLSDAQKLLLRMGTHNLQIIQQKLQDIQSELQRL